MSQNERLTQSIKNVTSYLENAEIMRKNLIAILPVRSDSEKRICVFAIAKMIQEEMKNNG